MHGGFDLSKVCINTRTHTHTHTHTPVFKRASGATVEALATFKTWLSSATCAEQCVTLHGPKSLGLVPRPHQKGFGLRFQGAVLEERDVDLLEDEQWFNDTIMDFFLRLAVEVAPPQLQEEKQCNSSMQRIERGAVESVHCHF